MTNPYNLIEREEAVKHWTKLIGLGAYLFPCTTNLKDDGDLVGKTGFGWKRNGARSVEEIIGHYDPYNRKHCLLYTSPSPRD